MQYNRLNGIVQKALQYTLNGQDKGYTLDYEYNNPKHPHAPSLIANSQSPKARSYQYDGNGNPTYYDEFKGFRSMVWDEENRLRGINDNGRLHLYTYDHTGERALKSSAESSMAVINGLASAVITHTEDYTAYVSPYFVVQKGKFTKHYFEGSSRVVSKLGEGTFSHKNTGIMAGGLDYLKRTQKEQEARDRYIKGLNVPPGPPTQHGIYTTPEWTGQPYPSIDWQSISQNQEPPAGWPRYPRFNEPGDVPGPPVQFGPPVTNANVKAGHGFIPNGVEEKNLYYYHPDHLGSSSYITDREGQIIQHTEYMAFGEVLVDEHSVSNKQPYLFNGKELDYETGLYYYGARYYDAKTSIFLNVDPLVEKTGTPYAYTYNNPIRYIDPKGMEPEDIIKIFNNGKIERTKDNNPYDTIINENGSKSIQIARTNISSDNPRGNSQIGEATTISINTPGHSGSKGSGQYTYLQINNDDVAKQFFEFAAENTSVEFTRDTFHFPDGFSSNVITTSHMTDVSLSAYFTLPYNDLKGGEGFHIIKDAQSIVFDHSHPPDTRLIAPGGFETRFNNGVPTFYPVVAGGFVDANVVKRNPIFKSANVYTTWQYPTPGKGYINYNHQTATYTGNVRK